MHGEAKETVADRAKAAEKRSHTKSIIKERVTMQKPKKQRKHGGATFSNKKARLGLMALSIHHFDTPELTGRNTGSDTALHNMAEPLAERSAPPSSIAAVQKKRRQAEEKTKDPTSKKSAELQR